MARFFERLPSLRASLPWILVALSLTLNLFFLGGYYYKRTVEHRLFGGTAQERSRYVAEHLNFDPDQRQRFQEFRQATRERQRAMFRANRVVIDNLWREIEKPEPDVKQIDGYINALTGNRQNFQREQMHELVRFARTLDGDQRLEFLELVRTRLEHGFHHRSEKRPPQ
jgi:Spy/CpxP family protein refolding chaperone